MQRIRCRVGEAIQVGDEVELVIEAIEHDADIVQLEIHAPRDITVRAVSVPQSRPLAARSRVEDQGSD